MAKILGETMLIMNLRNVAVEHKRDCNTNCNVSLSQLTMTAEYLFNAMSLRLLEIPVEDYRIATDCLYDMRELK